MSPLNIAIAKINIEVKYVTLKIVNLHFEFSIDISIWVDVRNATFVFSTGSKQCQRRRVLLNSTRRTHLFIIIVIQVEMVIKIFDMK